jgi:hypothetical protein
MYGSSGRIDRPLRGIARYGREELGSGGVRGDEGPALRSALRRVADLLVIGDRIIRDRPRSAFSPPSTWTAWRTSG